MWSLPASSTLSVWAGHGCEGWDGGVKSSCRHWVHYGFHVPLHQDPESQAFFAPNFRTILTQCAFPAHLHGYIIHVRTHQEKKWRVISDCCLDSHVRPLGWESKNSYTSASWCVTSVSCRPWCFGITIAVDAISPRVEHERLVFWPLN